MLTIYQLKATGILKGFYDNHAIFSKKVFTSKKAAEGHVPAFKKLVTNPEEFCVLGDPVAIYIHELELDASLIKIDFGGKGNGN